MLRSGRGRCGALANAGRLCKLSESIDPVGERVGPRSVRFERRRVRRRKSRAQRLPFSARSRLKRRMPHAIRVHQVGGPEVLKWEEDEAGHPGDDQVRLRQEAAGLNFIYVYHRTGLYPQPLPFTPGTEGAGVIEAVGPGVTHVQAGDRVAYAGPVGGYAEERLIDA